MPIITKDTKITRELNTLTAIFDKLPENKKAVVMPLIQNAAFMKVTLEDLQKRINEEGATDAYQNGENQHGYKPSATLTAYNQLIKNYNTVINTLIKHLPEDISIGLLEQMKERLGD